MTTIFPAGLLIVSVLSAGIVRSQTVVAESENSSLITEVLSSQGTGQSSAHLDSRVIDQESAHRAGPSGELSVSFPYAFSWDTMGVSGVFGQLRNGHNLVGGEVSYFGGESMPVAISSAGRAVERFNVNQEITMLDFAYRHFSSPGGFMPADSISFYEGGGAGVGNVAYFGSPQGLSLHDNLPDSVSGDLLAGVLVRVPGDAVLRLGYRYLFISNASKFDQRVNVGSGAIDATFNLRF